MFSIEDGIDYVMFNACSVSNKDWETESVQKKFNPLSRFDHLTDQVPKNFFEPYDSFIDRYLEEGEDGFTIKDVRNNIIWLRCTAGQTWDYDVNSCVGEIVKLNHEEVEIAKTQAAEQLGGTWRLPTLEELQSLVCEKCEKPKINEKYFPKISPEAYWTQTQNKFNSKMYWTVNFMTGHNYSRFFAYQQLPVLLVQDR